MNAHALGGPEDLLAAMLAIPSLSGEEEALAAHLEQTMTAMGFTARRDEAGNVIGDIGAAVPTGAESGTEEAGRGPTVMLLSHLDTVAPYLPARRDAHRLYGRGAVDAKAPSPR